MRAALRWALLVGSAVASACAITPKAPVALVGPESDRGALTGRWVGEYSSGVTGREGTIVFDLTARGDTARGEVWMIGRPASGNAYRPDAAPYVEITRPAEVLTIHIVSVQDGVLRGVLDPYRDPETQAVLVTVFRGRLEGDEITGEYATTDQETGELSSGRWRVERRPAKVTDEKR